MYHSVMIIYNQSGTVTDPHNDTNIMNIKIIISSLLSLVVHEAFNSYFQHRADFILKNLLNFPEKNGQQFLPSIKIQF